MEVGDTTLGTDGRTAGEEEEEEEEMTNER